MKYLNKTMIELKDIAKRSGLKGYSKMCKEELIKFIKQKKVKKVVYKLMKRRGGGNENGNEKEGEGNENNKKK